MKKLFGGGKKREKEGSLVGKVVMVGQFKVRADALVGEGGFATIYRCTDERSGQLFALKHMRLASEAEAIRDVQHEAKTMARLKGHPNILKLHAVAFAGPPGAETDGFMLLDYCPVTLLEVMQKAGFELDNFLVYEVFQDVAWAVAHMHKCSPPLAHRDLKAENVLKNGEGRWVICDFGSTTSRAQVYETAAEIAVEEDNIRRTTTPAYRAPEMWDLFTRQRIDTAVDVWALGVLLYVLAFGKLPFQGDSKLSILYGKYEMPPGRPPAMRALIADMLQVNPADRPDIFQVVSRLDPLRAALMAEAGGTPLPAPPPQPAPQPLLPAHLPAAANGAAPSGPPVAPYPLLPGQPGPAPPLPPAARPSPLFVHAGPGPLSQGLQHHPHMGARLAAGAHPAPSGVLPPHQQPARPPVPAPHGMPAQQAAADTPPPQPSQPHQLPYTSPGQPAPHAAHPHPPQHPAGPPVPHQPAPNLLPRFLSQPGPPGAPHPLPRQPSRGDSSAAPEGPGAAGAGDFMPSWPAPAASPPLQGPDAGVAVQLGAAHVPQGTPAAAVSPRGGSLIDEAFAGELPPWSEEGPAGPGPGSAAVAAAQPPRHRRTGSEGLRRQSLQRHSSSARHAMPTGFEDDAVDWGGQAVFVEASVSAAVLPTFGSEGHAAQAAATKDWPHPAQAGQAELLPAEESLLGGLASGDHGGLQGQRSAGHAAASWGPQEAGLDAAGPGGHLADSGRRLSRDVSRGGRSLEEGGGREVAALREQLQQLSAHNGALEGRVRQLEALAASQGALLQRMAAELQALQQQQQHPQQHPQHPQHLARRHSQPHSHPQPQPHPHPQQPTHAQQQQHHSHSHPQQQHPQQQHPQQQHPGSYPAVPGSQGVPAVAAAPPTSLLDDDGPVAAPAGWRHGSSGAAAYGAASSGFGAEPDPWAGQPDERAASTTTSVLSYPQIGYGDL